jgi:hypothetical protein
VDVETIHPVKKLIFTKEEKASKAELEDLLKSMQVQIKPVVKTASEEAHTSSSS